MARPKARVREWPAKGLMGKGDAAIGVPGRPPLRADPGLPRPMDARRADIRNAPEQRCTCMPKAQFKPERLHLNRGEYNKHKAVPL